MTQNNPVPWWNIEIGEPGVEHVTKAIRNRNISQGALTAEFERALADRLGVPHVVCTTSGTMALTMAYMAAGIGPGDEIIVPNRTWIATANAAILMGAKVKIVDTRPDSMLIDENLIEDAIGAATKAIVPVPLNGNAVDIHRINSIADKHGLVVIEDSAQALFSRNGNRYIGTNTRFACFSLGMAKVLTTGAGGFVVCHTDEDLERLHRIRNQGMSAYDISERHSHLGSNFKFTDIQAAIGLSQFDRIDTRIERQLELYRRYRDALKDVRCLKMVELNIESGEVPQRAEFMCTDRVGFAEAMREQGVMVCLQSPNISNFPFVGYDPADFPNSIPYAEFNLVLPSGPDQPLENVDRAIEAALAVADRFDPWDA